MSNGAHRIKKPGPGQWPDMYVVVQAGTQMTYQSEVDEWGARELGLWGCRVIRGNPGKSPLITNHAGGSAADWWALLATVALGARSVWIVTAGAREQMGLLGLWQLADDGKLRFACDHEAKGLRGGERDSPCDKLIVLENPPTIVCFRLVDLPACTYTWVDPANYGAGDLGRLLGRYCAVGELHESQPREWSSYPGMVSLQVDSVSIWLNGYLRLLHQRGLGGPKHTAASQAWAGWRRRYQPVQVTVHGDDLVTRGERQALYGGRNECRLVGGVDGQVFHFDVNSLYPSVAADANLPVRLYRVHDERAADTLSVAMAEHCVIARVDVDVPVPCVPRRVRLEPADTSTPALAALIADDPTRGTTTVYPIGRFTTWLCGPEIHLAGQVGTVLDCHRLYVYERANLYRQWVHDLYEARRKAAQKGDLALADSCKSILNSSFGKWAQVAKRWVTDHDGRCPYRYYQWWCQDQETRELRQSRCLAGVVQRMERHGERPDNFVAITAYIHSLARVRLWRLMLTAGYANVLYYDTDSLFVTLEGRRRLAAHYEIDEHALGKLSLRGEYSRCQWWGTKRYECDGKITLAGAQTDAMRAGDAFALTYNNASVGHFLYAAQPPGIARHISRVQLQVPYKLGHVQPDGRVTPIVLDE